MAQEPRQIKAVIYPKSKKVACVLLQVIYGGSRHVPMLFDTKLWAVSPPEEKPVGVSGTKEEWEKLANVWKKETQENEAVQKVSVESKRRPKRNPKRVLRHQAQRA